MKAYVVVLLIVLLAMFAGFGIEFDAGFSADGMSEGGFNAF